MLEARKLVNPRGCLHSSRFTLSDLPVRRYCFKVYSYALSAPPPTDRSSEAKPRQDEDKNLTNVREELTTKHPASPKRPTFGKHPPRPGEVPHGQYGIHTSDLGPLSCLQLGAGNGTDLLIMLFLPGGLCDCRVLQLEARDLGQVGHIRTFC